MFELSAVWRYVALTEVKAKFDPVPTCFGVARRSAARNQSGNTWVINQHNNLGYFNVKFSFCLLFKPLISLLEHHQCFSAILANHKQGWLKVWSFSQVEPRSHILLFRYIRGQESTLIYNNALRPLRSAFLHKWRLACAAKERSKF